jgi:hypothetical protein
MGGVNGLSLIGRLTLNGMSLSETAISRSRPRRDLPIRVIRLCS